MRENGKSLVRPMFDGPVDIVGDIHGEIDALGDLLKHLGYDNAGRHADGRRLVFLGDLIDRGPDSVAVVDRVKALVDAGYAQCILGNHELNILRRKQAPHTRWFDSKPWLHEHGDVQIEIPQRLLPASRRDEFMAFFESLPVALEREDLRVVHACWDDAAIEQLRSAAHVMAAYQQARTRIKQQLSDNGYADEVDRSLFFQNGNPVKLITSGPEVRAIEPFYAGGKLRHEARHPWWEDYEADATCICGHYWRTPLPGKLTGDSLFAGYNHHDPLGTSRRVHCIDYSVGGRYLERLSGCERFQTQLCALRWPDGVLVFDDGASSR